MRIGEAMRRAVAVVKPDQTLREAAHLMRDGHLGALILVANGDGPLRPVGVVTDRDIVITVFGEDLEDQVDTLTVADIQINELVTAREDESVLSVLQRLSAAGVRRCPVVDADDGALVGIFTVDDAIYLLARQAAAVSHGLADIARLVPREKDNEAAHTV